MSQIKAVQDRSTQPKYRQVLEFMVEGIKNGQFKRGELLPSINEMAAANGSAKETIVKAYNALREKGIIVSRPGKGYFIANAEADVELNIFVLFDTFNAYKEILYAAFRKSLPAKSRCSIFFHHYNLEQFTNLIQSNAGNYNYYVIMPHFDEDVSALLRTIPAEQLLLLDQQVPGMAGETAAVFQDFEKDIQSALLEAMPRLRAYKSLHLVLGREHFQYVPASLIKGFQRFCRKHGVIGKLENNLNEARMTRGSAYLLFSDADLVKFILHTEKKKWVLGEDIGLISYDDTPLKSILCGGITVVSTDFEQMGRSAGELLSKRQKSQAANPCQLLLRKTL